MKISIIGSGNIGSAFISGLLRDGSVAPGDIWLTDILQDAQAPYAAKGIRTMQDNVEAVKNADIVVFCVKPFQACDVIRELMPFLADDALLVSFAAGVSLEQLALVTGKRPLFRVIPNTAMAICQSMTCIAVSGDTNAEHQNAVLRLFTHVGKAMIIDEALIDAATVVASCGTAFALRYLRASMAAAVEIGFRPAVAEAMIAQTMLGAALLVSELGNHPEVEIDKVTTPKGITIKGLTEMERAGFSLSAMQGIYAAFDKLKS
jgi:pyrroline-5-carboxylate reductase